MTIKTLKMVRFGPYIKETVVDFEQFTGKVFLVSGDTGAGKTTIFDAVCYALYGEPSGSLRKNDTLRNQDSVKGDKSYVELLFTGVDGRDYLVHRDTRALRAVGDKPAAMTKDSVNLTDLSDKTVTKGAKGSQQQGRGAHRIRPRVLYPRVDTSTGGVRQVPQPELGGAP